MLQGRCFAILKYNAEMTGMAIAIASVADSDELFAALRSVDISVPLRTVGRTTHHVENWTICRLLSTLADAQRLAFPVSLCHRDRPDFLIDAGETQVGVEVTEAISEQYAAYSALAEREFPNALLDPGHFRWGAPRRSVEEMRKLLRQSRLSAKPWMGDRLEREWAFFIQSVVDAKLTKLASLEFEKFDLNWLSIYDNLPLGNVDLEKAIAFLRPLLEDRWSRNPCFDAIYIEHRQMVAEISVSETNYLVLQDLWE
jgi:hypothetical protein